MNDNKRDCCSIGKQWLLRGPCEKKPIPTEVYNCLEKRALSTFSLSRAIKDRLLNVAILLCLICVQICLHSRLRAAESAPEPVKFRYGVVRAWRSAYGDVSDQKGKKEPSAALGDTIVVEVKNFNGWLIGEVDTFGYVDSDLLKDVNEYVVNVIRNRQFLQANYAFRIMRMATNDALDMQWSEASFRSGLLTRADIEAFSHESESKSAQFRLLQARGPKLAEDVIAGVLQIPSLTPLSRILPTTPKGQIETLEQVIQLLRRLQHKKAEELRLKINDLVLEGIHAENPDVEERGDGGGRIRRGEDDYFWFRFPLVENEENAKTWSALRNQILMARSVELTLTHSFADRTLTLPTAVEFVPDGKTPAPGRNLFELIMIREWQLVLALSVLMLCIGLFWSCAAKTDIIRDTEAEMDADGRFPFSLARAQMAFWFLLVVAAFLFLWVSLGKLQVLNQTCLWLIGIGSGTALGAAVIRDSHDTTGVARYPKVRERGETRYQLMESLKLDIEKLDAVTTERSADDAASQEAVFRLRRQLADLRSQASSGVQRLLDDWLTENGRYSFHRYQMLVWSLVLGSVFVVHVASHRTLPEFDQTLLALMGISNGTYLGFRLVTEKRSAKNG